MGQVINDQCFEVSYELIIKDAGLRSMRVKYKEDRKPASFIILIWRVTLPFLHLSYELVARWFIALSTIIAYQAKEILNWILVTMLSFETRET